MANSRDVAFTADQLRSQDPAVAAQLSVSADEFARTPQATASLLESSDAPSVARIDDSAGIVQWVAVSPDRRLLAAAGADGTLRLWNVAAPGRPVLVSDLLSANSTDPVYAAAFSPDGKLLAAAGANRVVTLWEISGTKAVRLAQPLSGPANTVYSVAFSPDSATLAAASTDGTVRLWHVADPAQATQDGAPLVTPGAGTYPNSVAFSPDGRTLAAGHQRRHRLAVGPARYGRPRRRGCPGSAARNAVDRDRPTRSPAWRSARTGASSPPPARTSRSGCGGSRPAARSADGTLTGAVNWVNTVAFSPDGRSLAAARPPRTCWYGAWPPGR